MHQSARAFLCGPRFFCLLVILKLTILVNMSMNCCLSVLNLATDWQPVQTWPASQPMRVRIGSPKLVKQFITQTHFQINVLFKCFANNFIFFLILFSIVFDSHTLLMRLALYYTYTYI